MVQQHRDKTGHQPSVNPAAVKKLEGTFDDAMRRMTKEEWEAAKKTPGKLSPDLRAAIHDAIRQKAQAKKKSG